MNAEKKKKPVAAKIALSLAAVIVIVGIAGWLFISGKLGLIDRIKNENRINQNEETFEQDGDNGGESINSNEIDLNEDDINTFTAEDVKNILLIGSDARTKTEKHSRSDTMIICSINSKTKQIKLTSLMRDTYVAIPGFSKNRLNAAFAFGGMSLLNETIEKNFGIKIDGNVAVDFESFVEALVMVGDIEIEVSKEEANAVNRDGGFNIKPGLVTLTPDQALRYSRIRHLGRGDFDRTERQRKLVMAAFEKVKKLPFSEIMTLADKILPCFATDMTNGTIISYITQVLGGGYSMVGETLRIPVDGAWQYAMIDGKMAVVLPDLQKNSEALQEFIYGQTAR